MCSALRVGLLLAGVVGMVGCGGGGQDEQPEQPEQQPVLLTEMATQGQLWQQAAPTRYEIAVQYDCFCADARVRSVVDRGNVVDVSPAGAPPVTVDMLLADTRAMLAHGYASANVDYDPTLGYPSRVAIDPDRGLIDDEWGFHVTCFATGDAHCP